MALGFFSRLKQGLSRSTQKLGNNLTSVFNKKKLDEESLEQLEEILIAADFGPQVAENVIHTFRKNRFGSEVSDHDIKEALAQEIAKVLQPVAKPFQPNLEQKPHVVLMVGVNGTGKTTTVGKFAHVFKNKNLNVMLVAADTFRAAAVEQLQIWANRVGVSIVSGKPQADAAGLAFEALKRATNEHIDLLFIDTAGRLHNKSALMEELAKIIRVMRKFDVTAPHSVLLVLDATTGQNAIEQVRIFKEMVDVSGLIITKLDGTAKGGIVIAIAQQFGLPIHAVGVGEQIEDLRDFSAEEFALGLIGDSALEISTTEEESVG